MDKRTDMQTAIALVQDGDRVALGGMTLYRRPVAAALALAARPKRDLEVVTFTGGIETDLLIGAGCVSTLRSCYTGLEIVGFAPHYTQAAHNGSITLVEETEYTLSYALQAASMRVPFLPMLGSLARTDMLQVRPDLKRFKCPITAEDLIAVPSLALDVAIIHVTAADSAGNCNMQGQLALDPYLPTVAKLTIVTAEQIVDTEELMAMRGGIQIPGMFVSHVVPAKDGSLPTSCFPTNKLDLSGILDYADSCKSPEAWQQWLTVATEAYQ
ncbi:CoA transferase subunit A [Pollutimonas thiosulfatoxidans]|uniref:Ketoacid-CoA transferase n=1 Tax=Pollutimonas thiosulfatoxidans TaxID=2028345 RepID=A0A410GE84_9BURK|nr:CoA-transferase [Pollutimonas thiosulfatoxidans]QAA94601.1 ketoacid-CoA transferase [Pollutimonas thiosulfatoxidans]